MGPSRDVIACCGRAGTASPRATPWTCGVVALCILGGEGAGQCPTSAVTGDTAWLVPPYKIVPCDLLLPVRYSVWSGVVILSYITRAAGKAHGEGGREQKCTFQLLC